MKRISFKKDNKDVKEKSIWITIKKNYDMYLILIPGLVYLIIFKYLPMYGVTIAFQDFNIFKGISGSKWVGLMHFRNLLYSKEFFRVFRNTLLLSIYDIIFLFPLPIFIAIVLNEIKNIFYKKTVQTIIYLPHFLSWVVVSGIFINILSPSGGFVNNIISLFGGKPISFLMDKHWFRSILVISSGWKGAGWSAIIYIAAITGISPELYEAAKIDGAGRIKQIIYITLPGIASTIVMLFILRLGHILQVGTEQVLLMYNPTVYDVGDVIGTYVYRMGLGKMDYSFSTAVGLFNSVIGFVLVMIANALSRKLVKRSIW
ncbi:MAG: ABC transporter permease subunit [Clostridiales bacterium]|nr:ABC transporter permease subunit [Clostridiales bacterium]